MVTMWENSMLAWLWWSFHKVAIYVELAQLSCAQMQIVNILKQRLIHNIPSLLALTDLILNSSVKIMKH